MGATLECHGSGASLVQESWDAALDRLPGPQLGVLLYEALFELAPNVRPLFKRSRDVVALKCVAGGGGGGGGEGGRSGRPGR